METCKPVRELKTHLRRKFFEQLSTNHSVTTRGLNRHSFFGITVFNLKIIENLQHVDPLIKIISVTGSGCGLQGCCKRPVVFSPVKKFSPEPPEKKWRYQPNLKRNNQYRAFSCVAPCVFARRPFLCFLHAPCVFVRSRAFSRAFSCVLVRSRAFSCCY